MCQSLASVAIRCAKTVSSWNMSAAEGAMLALASFSILCTPRSTCCLQADHRRAAKGVAFTCSHRSWTLFSFQLHGTGLNPKLLSQQHPDEELESRVQRVSTWNSRDSGPQTACKQRTLTLMMMAWLSKAWLSATVMGRLCSTPSHLRTQELVNATCMQSAMCLCSPALT